MYEVVRKKSSYGPRLSLCKCASRAKAMAAAAKARAQLRKAGYRIAVTIGVSGGRKRKNWGEPATQWEIDDYKRQLANANDIQVASEVMDAWGRLRGHIYPSWAKQAVLAEAKKRGLTLPSTAPRNNPKSPSRSRYARTKLARKGDFDPRSFRYITVGKKRILIGCPKGKWSPSKRKCKVGTRGVTKLTPMRTNAAYPKLMKGVAYPTPESGYAFMSTRRYPVDPDTVMFSDEAGLRSATYVGQARIDGYPHFAWRIKAGRHAGKYIFQVARGYGF